MDLYDERTESRSETSTIRGTAQVVAASPNTEVVLFNEEALNSLDLESDKAVIWRNLAKVLAQRVVMTNQLLSE